MDAKQPKVAAKTADNNKKDQVVASAKPQPKKVVV